MNRLLACVGICGFICLASVGCGGGNADLGDVSGTVTMDGQPLANALVTFTPVEGGRSASGTTDASGQYQLAFAAEGGALIGQHKVTVTTVRQTQGSMAEVSSDSPEYMNQGRSDSSTAEVKEPIPAKYNTASTLVKEVTAGSNVIDLELTSE